LRLIQIYQQIEDSVSGYYRIYGTKAVDTATEDGIRCGWIGKGIKSWIVLWCRMTCTECGLVLDCLINKL